MQAVELSKSGYSRSEIMAKIQEVMVKLFELEPEKIVESARLYEDLDIDSIDAVDLMIELRPFVGKKFSADDFKQVRTISNIIDVIERLIR